MGQVRFPSPYANSRPRGHKQDHVSAAADLGIVQIDADNRVCLRPMIRKPPEGPPSVITRANLPSAQRHQSHSVLCIHRTLVGTAKGGEPLAGYLMCRPNIAYLLQLGIGPPTLTHGRFVSYNAGSASFQRQTFHSCFLPLYSLFSLPS